MKFVTCTSALLMLVGGTSFAGGPDVPTALRTLNAVGNGGQGHDRAIVAWRVVGRADEGELPVLLKAIDETKPLSANWIRAAVDQVVERTLANGRELPTAELEAIIFDQSYSARARRLAYEWLLQVDSTAEQRIIPQMLNDSSLEMRRDAVARALGQAEASASKREAIVKYRLALSAARDTDQIEEASQKLNELGVEVDLPKHFGFINDWKLIGPFDNTDKLGFDQPYPPEQQLVLDATYRGKVGEVQWISHHCEDKYGMVDLNKAIGKHMGAAAYALAEFYVSEDQQVDLRLGSICAAKVWLNGELVMSHEAYHAGTKIDQYVARGRMRSGRNQILLKICQNEQTDSWAQDWQFQFRVCDHLGTAILSEGKQPR